MFSNPDIKQLQRIQVRHIPVQESRGAMHQVSESGIACVGLVGGGGLAFLVLTDYFISGFTALSSLELAL